MHLREAVFFFITNTLIVFGLVAFDNAVAILNAFPFHFPSAPALPSPMLLVRALLLPARAYDEERIEGLSQAAERLRRKSRSFYLASGAFPGRLRIDLIILYSFCRVADDLVDNASSAEEARQWLKRLTMFLNLSYKSKNTVSRDANTGEIALYVAQNFPRSTHSAILQLPTEKLSSKPLYDLLKGFEMDLQFQVANSKNEDARYPIKSEQDLDLYSMRVAGTVAQLVLELVIFYYPESSATSAQKEVIAAGNSMGVALQYVNIARDVAVDARLQRIYIPSVWLKEEKMTPGQALKVLSVLDAQTGSKDQDAYFADKFERLRGRLLDRAFSLYQESRGTMESLPVQVRGPMRVAIESYMEIGRTLQKKGHVVKRGRATVPIWRRIFVAWGALNHA